MYSTESLEAMSKADKHKAGWCYRWLSSVWGGGGGGDGGGGSCCSSPLRCTLGASAMAKESVERMLRRRGARRRRLLGVHGRLSWARSEGATVLLSSSASANHGGICSWAMESWSGMKAGFSMPSGWKRESQSWEFRDVSASSGSIPLAYQQVAKAFGESRKIRLSFNCDLWQPTTRHCSSQFPPELQLYRLPISLNHKDR